MKFDLLQIIVKLLSFIVCLVLSGAVLNALYTPSHFIKSHTLIPIYLIWFFKNYFSFQFYWDIIDI